MKLLKTLHGAEFREEAEKERLRIAEEEAAVPSALASRAASKVEVELRVGATGAPLHAPLQLDHRVGKVLQR